PKRRRSQSASYLTATRPHILHQSSGWARIKAVSAPCSSSESNRTGSTYSTGFRGSEGSRCAAVAPTTLTGPGHFTAHDLPQYGGAFLPVGAPLFHRNSSHCPTAHRIASCASHHGSNMRSSSSSSPSPPYLTAAMPRDPAALISSNQSISTVSA